MKKIYLTFTMLGCALIANAQLTLTKAANEPVIGDSYSSYTCDSVSVLPKNTGANQTWDFSTLTVGTTVTNITYTTVSSTPNGSTYPTASFAESDGAGGFNYWLSTSTQYELLGFEGAQASATFSNSAIAAVWPISMGYNNTDAFAGSVTITGLGTGTITGNLLVMGSGTGTLTAPAGIVYNNVLQVKSVQTLYLSFLGGIATATSVTTDYDYYHSSQKSPILSVSYNETTGAQNNSSADITLNNPVVTGIKTINANNGFDIFPNPAKDAVTVSINNIVNTDAKIEVINTVGQTLKVFSLENDQKNLQQISVSDLSSGIYFVKTTIDNKSSIKKLVVQ